MRIYKVTKRTYINDLNGYLEKDATIQMYENKYKVIVSDVNNDVPIVGSITYLNDDSLWFYNIYKKTDFLSLESEVNESSPVATPMTQAERDLITLDTDDKHSIKIFNTDLSRREIWDGYHWIGDGDIVVKAIPNVIIGMMLTPTLTFQMETVRDVPIPVVGYIPQDPQGSFLRYYMGVVNHVSSDGLTMTLITNGLCYVRSQGPTVAGQAVLWSGFDNTGVAVANFYTPALIGLLLEDHPTNSVELKLMRLNNFAEKGN